MSAGCDEDRLKDWRECVVEVAELRKRTDDLIAEKKRLDDALDERMQKVDELITDLSEAEDESEGLESMLAAMVARGGGRIVLGSEEIDGAPELIVRVRPSGEATELVAVYRQKGDRDEA